MKKKYLKDYLPEEGRGEKFSYKYVGKYYFCERTKEERVKSAKRQIIYTAVTLLILIVILCIPALGTQTLYVVLPLELILLCHGYYFLGSFELLRVEEKMEQRFYDRVFERPIQALTVSLILEFFSLTGEIFGVLLRKPAGKEDMILVILLILHLPVSAVLWNRQRKEMHQIKEIRE